MLDSLHVLSLQCLWWCPHPCCWSHRRHCLAVQSILIDHLQKETLVVSNFICLRSATDQNYWSRQPLATLLVWPLAARSSHWRACSWVGGHCFCPLLLYHLQHCWDHLWCFFAGMVVSEIGQNCYRSLEKNFDRSTDRSEDKLWHLGLSRRSLTILLGLRHSASLSRS